MITGILALAALTISLANPSLAASSASPSGQQAATVAASQHRFSEAEQLLREHLRQHPRDGASWLQLASIAAVRADANSATDACAQAANFVDPIVTLGCRGRVALVTQDYGPAYHALSRMLQHPTYERQDDHWTGWSRGVAAELAVALQRHDEADTLFLRALAEWPSRPLQAAWLDHLLATSRYSQVLASVDVNEPDDVLQLRRLIALRRLGRSAESAALTDYYDWLYGMALARGESGAGREIARFYLDVRPRPERARLAAQRNLELQREAEDFALYWRAFAPEPITAGEAGKNMWPQVHPPAVPPRNRENTRP